MKLFIFFKFDSIAWSLRRIYCPVKKNDLVLEVGSGNSPYFRANVLCDAYIDTDERFHTELIVDRPMVISQVENLPFKNKAFDFVIASHVLEHSPFPEKFLSELQRVAKAGYIEVPDAFMERLTNYTFHRMEISNENNKLIIKKKSNSITDKDLFSLFRRKAGSVFEKWASKYPFHFHVRLYWNHKGINYKVLNPKTNANWLKNKLEKSSHTNNFKITKLFKLIFLKMFRFLFSQHSRNRNIDLLNLLQCRNCKSKKFNKFNNFFVCTACKKRIKYI